MTKKITVALSGKGGVGKTSLSALILDELALSGYSGRVLAVDADPAMTLYLALGLPEPKATVASIRDTTRLDAKTIRALPAGVSPAGYMSNQLREAGVLAKHQLREMSLDLLTMGQGEGPGCYCSVNGVLKTVLSSITSGYDLVLVDNEAGLEHLSRYRLGQVDFFLTVATPSPAAQAVARRIVETAETMGIEIGETWTVFNQTPPDFQPPRNGPTVVIPHTEAIGRLEMNEQAVVELEENNPVRRALRFAGSLSGALGI